MRFLKQALILSLVFAFLNVFFVNSVTVSTVHAQAPRANDPAEMERCLANMRGSQGNITERQIFQNNIFCESTVGQFSFAQAYQDCAIHEYDHIAASRTTAVTSAEITQIKARCRPRGDAMISTRTPNAAPVTNGRPTTVPSSRVGASGQAPSPLLFTQSPEDKFIGTLTGPTTQNLTSEYAEPLLRVGDIQTGFGVLVRFFLGFAGLIAVVYLVFNGFRYAMARGEDNQIGQAKKGITYAIVGLLLILAAYTIVATVLNFGAQPVSSVGVGVGISF